MDAVKLQLMVIAAEKVEVFTKLSAEEARSDRKLELLSVALGACDLVVFLYFVVKFCVPALHKFIIQVGIQLPDRYRAGLEVAYSGSQLACFHMLKQMSGVGATSIAMPNHGSIGGGNRYLNELNVPVPSPSRQITLPEKGLFVVPKVGILVDFSVAPPIPLPVFFY